MSLVWILLLPSSAGIVCADFRHRRVAVVHIVLLGFSAFVSECAAAGCRAASTNVLCNIELLLLLTASLFCWMRLRGIAFRRVFGAGDFAVMAACTPCFAPICYLRFLTAACLSSLVWWCVFGIRHRRTIPFAGVMCAVLIVYTLYVHLVS